RYPQGMVYELPFTFNATSSIPVPWLATGYSVSANGQIWNLTLRQGVTFSDGTPFNATAIKDGMDNFIIADAGLSLGLISSYIRDATSFLASNHNAANITQFKNTDGITVLGPYSVEFNFTKPNAGFIGLLDQAFYDFYVSPSALAANPTTPTVGNTWLQDHSDGTGPYTLSSYDPASGRIVLVANPSWWAIKQLGIKQPFEQITFNVVSNIATEELDLRTGVADLIALPATNLYDFADKATWLSSGKLVSDVSGVNLWGPFLTSTNDFINFNSAIKTANGTLATVQPFANPHLLMAFSYAWNESAFIQYDLNGLAISNPGLNVQGQLGYQNFQPPYPYSLTMAKSEITQACATLGCSPSNPITVNMIAYNDAISQAAGSLLTSNINSLNAGVKVVFQPLANDVPTWLSGQWAVQIVEMTSVTSEPIPLSVSLAVPPGVFAIFNGYKNQTVANLVSQALATNNVTLRAALYLQIDKDLAASGVYLKVAQFESVLATSSKIVINGNTNEWTFVNGYPSIFAMSSA
ncbi:MAG: hypothetical protein JRN67_13435, partial [Nitrososphaerota archaeon]|nr:hypothetical protein [Nitrososphaerota archaeon]